MVEEGRRREDRENSDQRIIEKLTPTPTPTLTPAPPPPPMPPTTPYTAIE